jgi:hypothetical protein
VVALVQQQFDASLSITPPLFGVVVSGVALKEISTDWKAW